MRVLHTYCLNYNIGDYALGMGVKNILRSELKIDLIGNTNIQGREFNEYYIQQVVNKRYDLLVIGGGGIIHGSHWPNGWFWLIDKELIKTIKIPFIVYGAGVNYFEDEYIPDKAVRHLEEVYKYATYFSVRNDGSYERLSKQVGFKPHEIPDPGFHVGLGIEYDRPVSEQYIVIQLANDKTTQRFSEGAKAEFITAMKTVAANLAKKYVVVFAPHVFYDLALSNAIAKDIENTQVLQFGDFAFDHSDKIIAYYKYAEFVLAMRGHGQIIPISFNVPIIALQNHPKHSGLMQKLNLCDYNIDVNGRNLQPKLEHAIAKLEKNKSILAEQYREINKNLLHQSKTALHTIKDRIG